MENSYDVRGGFRYPYGISFPLRLFNKRLEKHGNMRNQLGAQIALTAWGVLQLVVSLNVAFALAAPFEVLGNLIKYFGRR